MPGSLARHREKRLASRAVAGDGALHNLRSFPGFSAFWKKWRMGGSRSLTAVPGTLRDGRGPCQTIRRPMPAKGILCFPTLAPMRKQRWCTRTDCLEGAMRPDARTGMRKDRRAQRPPDRLCGPLKRGERSLAGSLGNWFRRRLAGTSSSKLLIILVGAQGLEPWTR